MWYVEKTKIFYSFVSISFSFKGNNQCLNVYCSSNSSFKYERKLFEDPNNIAAEAIKLTHEYGPAYLDEYMNSNLFLIEENLQQTINKSKQLNNWEFLQNLIYSVFSNRQHLSSSFLHKGFPINISLNIDTSSVTSATPKSRKILIQKKNLK